MAESLPIAIACAADSGYAMPLAVMLRSVGLHLSSRRTADAFVLDDGIADGDRARVEESLPPNIRVHWRQAPLLKGNLPLWGRMSATTYQKLTLGQWLPGEIERALWLDCDMLVLADVGELWDREFDGKVALAVQDQRVPLVCSRFGVAGWQELGLARDGKHFNAGLLLIDLSAWRAQDVFERSMAYLSDYCERVYFWDQEALNAVLSGEWGEIEGNWNRHPALHSLFHKESDKPNILHFSGNLKPWSFAGKSEYRALYRRYFEQTAWAGMPLRRTWRDGLLEWYECSRLRRMLYPTEQWATMAQRALTRVRQRTSKETTVGECEESKHTRRGK